MSRNPYQLLVGSTIKECGSHVTASPVDLSDLVSVRVKSIFPLAAEGLYWRCVPFRNGSSRLAYDCRLVEKGVLNTLFDI